MNAKQRAAKAELLTDDLNHAYQSAEAQTRKSIARKAKKEVLEYSTSFSAPLLLSPIPFVAREFFDFCNDDLGMTLEEVPHMEICDELAKAFPDLRFPVDQAKKFVLMLLPRTTYKTTICGIALPLFILSKNPNARILISAHRHDVAKERLKSIKRYLERDAIFREKYGVWVPEFREEKWSEDSIVITARTQNLNDPTVDTCAVDRNKDGSHPDVVIGDDIQSVVNAATPGMRIKVWEHIRSMSPMLQPGGTMLLIGTRKHNQDVYGKIQKINDELIASRKPPMFSILKHGAYNDDGSLYFPGRLTHEYLASEKLLMGPRMFANEYLNEPIEEGAKMFTKDKFADMQPLDYFIDPLCGTGIIQLRDGSQIPVFTTMVWDPAGHRPSDKTLKNIGGFLDQKELKAIPITWYHELLSTLCVTGRVCSEWRQSSVKKCGCIYCANISRTLASNALLSVKLNQRKLSLEELQRYNLWLTPEDLPWTSPAPPSGSKCSTTQK
jgi:hypothetical protein